MVAAADRIVPGAFVITTAPVRWGQCIIPAGVRCEVEQVTLVGTRRQFYLGCNGLGAWADRSEFKRA